MTEGFGFLDRVASYSRCARQLQKLSAGRRRLRRGTAYASAAGAALAGASAAEAAIVWSGPHNVMAQITGNNSNGLSIDTNTLLNFGLSYIPVVMSVYRKVNLASIIQRAEFYRTSGNFSFAGTVVVGMNFAPGESITGPFATTKARLADQNGTLNFIDGVPGYLGFEFNHKKGWIKVQWDDLTGDNRPDKLTAFEWAYEDSGGDIKAGQTGAVPEAGAAALMSLVACGVAGVMALKKLRRAS